MYISHKMSIFFLCHLLKNLGLLRTLEYSLTLPYQHQQKPSDQDGQGQGQELDKNYENEVLKL